MIKMMIENPNSFDNNQNNLKNDNLYNVYFERSTVIKINVRVSRNIRIAELLHIFLKNLKVQDIILKKTNWDYIYLFNGCIIQLNEQETLFNYGFGDNVNRIVFYLKNNMIGRKINNLYYWKVKKLYFILN